MGCQCRRLFDEHSGSTCVAPDPKSSAGRNALKQRSCRPDNDRWTFGDGFQTPQIPQKRLLIKRDARDQCRGQPRIRPQNRRFLHSCGLLETKRDGFNTPTPRYVCCCNVNGNERVLQIVSTPTSLATRVPSASRVPKTPWAGLRVIINGPT